MHKNDEMAVETKTQMKSWKERKEATPQFFKKQTTCQGSSKTQPNQATSHPISVSSVPVAVSCLPQSSDKLT